MKNVQQALDKCFKTMVFSKIPYYIYKSTSGDLNNPKLVPPNSEKYD